MHVVDRPCERASEQASEVNGRKREQATARMMTMTVIGWDRIASLDSKYGCSNWNELQYLDGWEGGEVHVNISLRLYFSFTWVNTSRASTVAHNMSTWQVSWLHVIIFCTLIFYDCCFVFVFSSKWVHVVRFDGRHGYSMYVTFWAYFYRPFFSLPPTSPPHAYICMYMHRYFVVAVDTDEKEKKAMTTMLIIAKHNQHTFILIITQEFRVRCESRRRRLVNTGKSLMRDRETEIERERERKA